MAEGLVACFLEASELIPILLIVVSGVFFLYLMGSGIYHLGFDPNAVDVAGRLDALSIDPDKWIGRT